MLTVRTKWRPEDPEIVSDVLFAVANVMSIARTTYIMPAFEVLGPLQISLGRMLGDITRFLVLFMLVCISLRTYFYTSVCFLLCKNGRVQTSALGPSFIPMFIIFSFSLAW